MMKLLLLFASLCIITILGQDELTPDNFDNVVDGTKSVFAMFYAPWCGHCKNFKPEYAKVANAFAKEESVAIVSIDADKYKNLGSKYGVSGFPTLKFFPKGSTDPEDYSSGRSAEDVVKYINDKSGTSVKIVEAPSPVITLTSKNFNEIALDKNKDVLVEFYAPWCGHCKKLKPVYDVVATAFQNEPNVVVAKVDATEENELGSKYEVKGYPTIKYFPKGSDDVIDYKSARSAQAFVEFLNENAGTRRKVDGTLSRSAGRYPELDILANKYFKNSNSRDETLKELNEKCIERENDCKYYLKYASKITEKGDDYIEKERDRLQKLSKSDSIVKEKRDNFVVRMNILNGFLEGEESVVEQKQEL